MARTYGMHFVDYFPNREKGIVLLEMSRIEEAKQCLETSINKFSSAKGVFYLDRIREKLFASKKSSSSYPRIALDSPESAVIEGAIWIKDDPVILNGDINDPHYVSEISINNTPIFLEHAMEHIRLHHPLTLDQGRHELNIRAKNLIGLESKQLIVLHVDREGPLLSIESMDENNNQIVVSGNVHDEAGIAKLTVKNSDVEQEIPDMQGHGGAVNHKVDRRFNVSVQADTGSIEISAIDRLNNRTVARVVLNQLSGMGSMEKDAVLIADSGGILSDADANRLFSHTLFYKIADDAAEVLADSAALNSSYLAQGVFQRLPTDSSPPVLSIPDWEETQTVYLKNVYLEGEVTDDRQIKSVTVNSVEKLKQPSAHIFFNHMVRLAPGENKITVSASDDQGNTVVRELTIIRNIADAFQSENRLNLSVLPF